MGKLEQKADGNYILEAKIGELSLKMALQDAEKPLAEIPDTPMKDGFYLHIPDITGENDK